MIQPQELRIGNLILDRGKPVDLKCSQLVNIITGKYVDEYKPIPLTEEWLLKFGFISDYISYKLENNNYLIELYFYDCWNLNYIEKEKFGNGNVELKGYWNVHQLQNLYFALTGEELIFKNK